MSFLEIIIKNGFKLFLNIVYSQTPISQMYTKMFVGEHNVSVTFIRRRPNVMDAKKNVEATLCVYCVLIQISKKPTCTASFAFFSIITSHFVREVATSTF